MRIMARFYKTLFQSPSRPVFAGRPADKPWRARARLLEEYFGTLGQRLREGGASALGWWTEPISIATTICSERIERPACGRPAAGIEDRKRPPPDKSGPHAARLMAAAFLQCAGRAR